MFNEFNDRQLSQLLNKLNELQLHLQLIQCVHNYWIQEELLLIKHKLHVF